MILSVLTALLTFLYVVFILWCHRNWLKIRDKSTDALIHSDIKVAVIVPVRNEEKNLSFLLQALTNQNYPDENFEIIIVDDHSTDNSFEIVNSYFKNGDFKNGRCLRNAGNSKKMALTYGIENTNAELIITTDADVNMDEDWIAAIVNDYVETNAFMICGCVKLRSTNRVFEKLQQLEFMGLSGIAAAGIASNNPMFCNAANLAFSKKIFDELGGYDQSLSASGDDTQLMLKMHSSHPGKISFLKDTRAVVVTNVMERSSDLLHQRKRWASKIPNTLSTFTVLVAVIAWLVHALLLVQIFMAVFHDRILLLLLLFSMKIISEMFFLNSTGQFFKVRIPLLMIILIQPAYCLYIFLVGLISPFGNYRWKGRWVR